MSASITDRDRFLAQVIAAELWGNMKAKGMTYEDICNVCAVLLLNVAKKSESTSQEIIGRVSEKMRAEAKNSVELTPTD